jgi:UDP-N-acetylmuramoyl-tripeptide--D-alanyl-D-alanine ligase
MFTLAEIAAWLGMEGKAFPSAPVRHVITDSRQTEGGELFVALKGKKFDGHEYLAEVAKKGAVAALVSNEYSGPDHGLILFHVPDVIEALQIMAKKRLDCTKPRIVGVTGSVGKTTTKDFISTLLAKRFKIGKSPGNANSQIGLPTSILNLSGDEELLILEMAMSEPGQIAKLAALAPPEIAVITKIGLSHPKLFANGIEGIAEAKAEILSQGATKWGVISSQAGSYPVVRLKGDAKKLFVGEGPEADVRFFKEGPNVRICIKDEMSGLISLPFTASHLVEDFALAATVAHLLGISFQEIEENAKDLKTVKNRFELVEKGGIFFLNDSHNASPESMLAALDNFPKVNGKAFAVFGEMPELGSYWHSAHTGVATRALTFIDHLLCYGEGTTPMVEVFSQAGRPVELFDDFNKLKRRVYELASPGDLVFIKGANFNKLWRILDEEVDR